MEEMELNLDLVLREGRNLISANVKKENEIIALIGNTGSGKSTLAKFLTRDNSLKIVKNIKWLFADSQSTISGGGADSFVSKTLLPNVTQDNTSESTIVDCAGLKDTRSSQMDFIAAIMNNEILQMASRIKIVIVENNSNLTEGENRDGLKKSLLQISELLKFNHTLFGDSIGLVANKVDSRSEDDELIEEISLFLKDLQESLRNRNNSADLDVETCERAADILGYLQKGRIGILRRPSKAADNPWELEDLEKNYNDLRKLIFDELQFTTNGADKFNITVAPETKTWIKEKLIDQTYSDLNTLLEPIIKELEERTKEELQSVGGKPEKQVAGVISVGEKIISQLSEVKSVEDFISPHRNYAHPDQVEEINFCLWKLYFIGKVVQRDVTDKTDPAIELFRRLETLINEIRDEIVLHEMLSDLLNDLKRYRILIKKQEILQRIEAIDTENFKTELLALCGAFKFDRNIFRKITSPKKITTAHIEKFKAYVRSVYNGGFSVTNLRPKIKCLQAKYIILSQQKKLIDQISQYSHQIVITATERVIIDCDLTLKNIHLVIIAPLIEVINGKRVIKLLGECGAQHAENKARSSENNKEDGERGCDGNPGYSSGTCKIVANDIVNAHLLEIFSQGGNGSDGQDGGDGHSISCQRPKFVGSQVASNEEKFEINDFVSYVQSEFHDVKVVKENGTSFEIRFEVHPDLTRVKPSDGGNGGDAGKSAVAGDVKVFVENVAKKKQVVVCRQAGVDGRVGKGGSGGKAKGMFETFLCSVQPYNPPQDDSTLTKMVKIVGKGLTTAAATTGAIFAAPVALEAAALAGVAAAAGASAVTVPELISMASSKLFAQKFWHVQVLTSLSSGECDCAIYEKIDGNNGASAFDAPNPRYKFKSMSSSNEIKKAFENFAKKHGYHEEEGYQRLMDYNKI